MKVKEESFSAGLKCIIQKTKIRASGPVTSWRIDGEKVKAVIDSIFLGSKITMNIKIKRRLLSILIEINPEDSLEKLMLMLKLQFFGHLL